MTHARMTFGKYKGQRIEEVPTPYLRWLVAEEILKDVELEEAVIAELHARREERAAMLDDIFEASPPPNWDEALRQVRRELALQFHPDRGGSHEQMLVVNAVFDRLAELTEPLTV